MIRLLETHTDVVSALIWLPDGSGFISGGLDRKIILWVSVPPDTMGSVHSLIFRYQDADGKQRDSWGRTPIRVTDLAITSDFTRLVAVGMYDAPAPPAATPQKRALRRLEERYQFMDQDRRKTVSLFTTWLRSCLHCACSLSFCSKH